MGPSSGLDDDDDGAGGGGVILESSRRLQLCHLLSRVRLADHATLLGLSNDAEGGEGD